jgi:hypothetical protein
MVDRTQFGQIRVDGRMKVLFFLLLVVLGYLLYVHSPMLFLYLLGAILLYKVFIGNRSNKEYLYYFYTPEYLKGILFQMQKHSAQMDRLLALLERISLPGSPEPDLSTPIPPIAETHDEFEHVGITG